MVMVHQILITGKTSSRHIDSFYKSNALYKGEQSLNESQFYIPVHGPHLMADILPVYRRGSPALLILELGAVRDQETGVATGASLSVRCRELSSPFSFCTVDAELT